MAERKGLSAPVPSTSARGDGEASDRRAGVSAAVPLERGRLHLEGGGGLWPLTGTRLLLGRAGGGVGVDVEIADDSVSRRHAELVATPDGWVIRDLGSVNGTAVAGVVVPAGQGVVIKAGQRLRLGGVEFCVVTR